MVMIAKPGAATVWQGPGMTTAQAPKRGPWTQILKLSFTPSILPLTLLVPSLFRQTCPLSASLSLQPFNDLIWCKVFPFFSPQELVEFLKTGLCPLRLGLPEDRQGYIPSHLCSLSTGLSSGPQEGLVVFLLPGSTWGRNTRLFACVAP